MYTLTSINIAQPRLVGKTRTGIDKQPFNGAISVMREGLPGDFIGSVKHHGGPGQALYIYGAADYAWWRTEMGRDLPPGIFGENLTIEGLESASVAVGDRLTIGDVLLEVTAPRIPCGTFAAWMGEEGFAMRFRRAGRPGLYVRVLTPGALQAGMPVAYQPYDGERVTILEMFEDYYDKCMDETCIRRLLAAPIAERDRRKIEQRLPAV
ncbi:MAG: MOSC domain-containing protein [Anaerolineae bacterium]|nr:MOSC domain-containing protein [Anaerolineae bacterium]